ncbi:Glypican-1 [Taenia solium]|eukprot:TsM_000295000 transcript=TsM_000295000 gene=TsM_000295000
MSRMVSWDVLQLRSRRTRSRLESPRRGAKKACCSWTLEKATSSKVSQVLRILRSLSGPHVCGYSSRWSAAGRRGHLTVWEFMKRTKMTGRVFYLLRSVVHLMETTKTLEYLQWLLQQLSSFDLGSHGCDRVLLQMRHCSLCAGYPLVHPCPAFCEVSLARCLRPINKFQSSWTNLINTLYDQLQAWSNFTNPMIRSIMLHAPQAILEFYRVIMKAVLDEVPQECRIDLVTASLERDDSLDFTASIGRKRPTTPISTQTQFMRISHKLQSLKRLWVSAPSKICRESPHLSSSTAVSSQACWNGTAIGPINSLPRMSIQATGHAYRGRRRSLSVDVYGGVQAQSTAP